MKLLRNILIFISLMGVFVIAFNVSIREKRKQFKFCRPYDVTQIQNQSPDHIFTANFDEEMAQWKIQIGKELVLGHNEAFESLKLFSCYLPYSDKFEFENELTISDLKQYGLDEPSYKLDVKAKTDFSILIGKKTPSKTEYYMISSTDNKNVYTIPNKFFEYLFPTWFSFHTRNIFYSNLKNTGKFNIAFGTDKYEFVYRDGNWFESNGKTQADQTKEFIELLKIVTFTNFHGPIEDIKTFDQHDLSYPDIILSFSDGKNKEIPDYSFFSTVQKTFVHVTVNDENYVVIPKSHHMRKIINWYRNL